MKKKIVVTGALGHIGSRLIRGLPDLFENLEIVMIDDISSQRYAALFNLPKNADYEFIEGNIIKLPLEKLFKDASAVIHLAAITDATNSFDKAAVVEENNFGGTKKVAEACTLLGVPLIFPSSTSVYGCQTDLVDESCDETDLKPQSPYAESKLKEEYFLKEMHAKYHLKVSICRLGTIYGISEGMRFHTAVNKFCWQAMTETPLTVWKTAYEQKRPYLDLGDCIRAMVFIIQKSLFQGEIFNVVTENRTVKEVIENIKKYVKNVTINYVDTQIMNQLSYEVSNHKLKNLGFSFKGDMNLGISDTIRLLKQMNSKRDVIACELS